jgi:phosphoribosylformylglycinamidine cyclo-ligase
VKRVQSSSYGEAGVSLAKAEEVVERLRAAVESTRTERVEGPLGAFAGLFALDDERLLAATTDGVGTKLILSRRAGRLFDAGVDLAAHCANDLLTVGAEPLFFLDYVAAAALDLAEVAELVAGAASVCRQAGCALLGGETAELPGIYREGELDFAGTMVGLVRRADLVDGSRCEPGDAVLGLPSSGLHANGFTLVRRVLGDDDFDPDLLLAPTRLYLDDVRRLRAACDVRALAHVTGGGLPGNLPRVLPADLGASLDPASWERPPVYAWLDARGVAEEEQRRVFNLGVGFCAVVPGADADRAGFPVIGRLEEGEGVRWTDAR